MMKQTMSAVTIIAALGTITFWILYCFSKNAIMFTCVISFGVTFYHLAMRLLIGLIIGKNLAPYISVQHKWFQEKSFEHRLYHIIKVKNWKKYIPTYAPQTFQLKKGQLEHVLTTMCASELVHEAIMICSFLPILGSFLVGKLPVFLITSSLAATIDGIFVLMQRFNRPRLVKLIEKQSTAFRIK